MSTKALKIILQILNAMVLVGAVVMIGFGAFCLDVKKYVEEGYPPENSTGVINFLKNYTKKLILDEVPIVKIISLTLLNARWACIVVGSLFLFLQIFGIYAVAKEHAGKISIYGSIHLVVLSLKIIIFIFKFKFVSLVLNIIFLSAIVSLSYVLAFRHFREKPTNKFTRPSYYLKASYMVKVLPDKA